MREEITKALQSITNELMHIINICWRLIGTCIGHIVVRIISATLLCFYFRVLHRKRIEIIGKENLPKKGKVLIYANHPTIAIETIVIPLLFYPKFIFHPKALPYTPAAQERFFLKNLVDVPRIGKIIFISWISLKWIMKHGHVIPVRPGRRDSKVLARLIDLIKKGCSIFILPEGRRTRDKNGVDKFKIGIGMIYYKTKPEFVIPIKVEGADKILPIGQRWPKWGKGKVTIIIGKSINKKLQEDVEELSKSRMPNREIYRIVAEKMREELLKLQI